MFDIDCMFCSKFNIEKHGPFLCTHPRTYALTFAILVESFRDVTKANGRSMGIPKSLGGFKNRTYEHNVSLAWVAWNWTNNSRAPIALHLPTNLPEACCQTGPWYTLVWMAGVWIGDPFCQDQCPNGAPTLCGGFPRSHKDSTWDRSIQQWGRITQTALNSIYSRLNRPKGWLFLSSGVPWKRARPALSRYFPWGKSLALYSH